ncbi:MAG: NAD-dependent deacylase [Abditibacteriales bacterium]|nr:NAD-dependent deacylase [Abditibacteriales bacterium]MDW8365455.1 NAD-dependent deacylase [Abditibacteriales bacterium]
MKPEIPLELTASLRAARHVVALTGSGISAESGVPTFRDAQTGLWAQYRPEDLATPEAFRRNPQLVWEWYAWRRQLVAEAQPNPGHLALVELERRVPQFTLITQNVDGLHQRAGSRNVIELHGNIARTKCFNEDLIVESWTQTGDLPPCCPRCGGPLRPDVVWFSEPLPPHALQAAWQAAASCDLFFSIGTSSLVEPAASLPYVALRNRATVVEVNTHPTPLTPYAAFSLRGAAGLILPALVEESLCSKRGNFL